ncbi:hypothetical protein FQN51_007913 [Onygenales sp. PD_10]|nr:hypothetical protein FQN51_007913 [Onygenales sp. PD_10]
MSPIHQFYPQLQNRSIYHQRPRLLGRSQVAQDGWNVPDGGQDDFTVTLRKGQAVPFSWSGWDSSWTDTFLNGESINDLWVTSYDYHVTPFSELITQEIDVSRAGSFTWTIDIPDASLSKTAKYVLRFKNAADPPDSYNQTSPQLSSPGFIVVNGVKSTTTSTPSATSSSSSSSSSTSTPATSSATPTPQPQTPGASGLSTGAKAGIGAGAAVGGIAIIALIVLLVVRRRPRQDQQQPAPNEYGHYHPQHRSSKPPVSYINEAPNSLSMAPAELPATPRW